MRLSRHLPACAAFAVVLALAAPRHAVALEPTPSDTMFGYRIGVGVQELVTQASAVWNVAAATQHEANVEESARAYVAFGGLAVGTQVTVSPAGTATYRAYYSGGLTSDVTVPLVVSAGDDVRGTIERTSVLSLKWRLTLTNLTAGTTWSTKVYDAVANENVLVMAEGWVPHYDEFWYGYPQMPDMPVIRFDEITVNGANPALHPDERVVMIAYDGESIVAAPSLPQADGNGFGACVWADTCAVPADF